MKKLITSFVVPIVLALGMSNAYAQNEGPMWAPMELIGCTFVGDSDMDDLNAVIDSWNEWMDEHEANDYTAVALSPFFTAGSFPYEALWVGVWRNGAALGGLQQWLAEGGEIQDDFADVVACPLHQGFALNNVKPPVEPTGIVPVAFSNCTINDGRTGPEARAAIVEWTNYLAENGSEAGHWILRPAAGEEADADYSFKWVRAYPSYEAMGNYFDIVYNRGGFQRLQTTIGRVMSCDSPRIYSSRVVREMAEE